jgi:hypothetical protein
MSRIQLIENEEELIICISKNPNWSILILTGIWLTGLLGMLSIFLYDFIITRRIESDIILFLSFFIFVGLFVLKAFLWNLRGKEKISLNNKELKIEHLGTVLSYASKYDMNFIGGFEEATKVKIPWLIKIYGFAGGQIQFRYWEQIRYFGQSLETNEIDNIVNTLNDKLKRFTKKQAYLK